MKRWLMSLLCLCLMPLTPGLAQNQLLPLPDKSDWSMMLAQSGERLYLLSIENALFGWKAGQTALEPLEPLPALKELDTTEALFMLDGGLYVKAYQDDLLRLIYQEQAGRPESIRLPLSRDVQGAGKSSGLRSSFSDEAGVWFMLDKHYREDYILCRYDRATQKIKAYEQSQGLYIYCPLDENRVLLVDHLLQKERLFGRFRMLDTKSGKVSTLMETPWLARSPGYEAGSLLFEAESGLWRWDLKGKPQRLADLPVKDPAHNPGIVVDGKLAVNFDNGLYLSDPAATSEGSLQVIGDSPTNFYTRGYASFMEQNPGISVSNLPTAANKDSFGTGDLADRIRTGGLQYDVMLMHTTQYDLPLLIEKGYCAELQDDPELLRLVMRMHPAIRDQVMKDGKLYGLPVSLSGIRTLSIQDYGFQMTTLSQETLPDSFEGLIDLMGNWRSYQKQGDETSRPFEMGDTAWVLKNRAISFYINELLRSGQPLRFNQPEFLRLLKQIEASRLPKEQGPGPFAFVQGYENLFNAQALTLSLFEGGQRMQPARLWLYIINSRSENQALARQYLRTAAAAMLDEHSALLDASWTEPIENASYQDYLTQWQEEHKQLENKLSKAGSGAARREAQNRLDDHQQKHEEQLDLRRWKVSPAALSNYRERIAPCLFFPAPSVFTDWNQPSAVLLDKEIKRYLDGHMSAEQLAQSLDQKARLMELENR